jgi:pSer/pThr/pTyr-binding forkhead associated (FHA) protein
VDQPIMTIGRDRERPICIPDESVSRLHAQIVRQQVGYFVSDLHSSNGTFLNGDLLIAPSLLSPGDILRVGAIELRCDASLLESPSQTTIPLDESARIAQTA